MATNKKSKKAFVFPIKRVGIEDVHAAATSTKAKKEALAKAVAVAEQSS